MRGRGNIKMRKNRQIIPCRLDAIVVAFILLFHVRDHMICPWPTRPCSKNVKLTPGARWLAASGTRKTQTDLAWYGYFEHPGTIGYDGSRKGVIAKGNNKSE
jgi:hypothetical protein